MKCEQKKLNVAATQWERSTDAWVYFKMIIICLTWMLMLLLVFNIKRFYNDSTHDKSIAWQDIPWNDRLTILANRSNERLTVSKTPQKKKNSKQNLFNKSVKLFQKLISYCWSINKNGWLNFKTAPRVAGATKRKLIKKIFRVVFSKKKPKKVTVVVL